MDKTRQRTQKQKPKSGSERQELNSEQNTQKCGHTQNVCRISVHYVRASHIPDTASDSVHCWHNQYRTVESGGQMCVCHHIIGKCNDNGITCWKSFGQWFERTLKTTQLIVISTLTDRGIKNPQLQLRSDGYVPSFNIKLNVLW